MLSGMVMATFREFTGCLAYTQTVSAASCETAVCTVCFGIMWLVYNKHHEVDVVRVAITTNSEMLTTASSVCSADEMQ